ncbi:MAG TPA: AHH domain-containing protein, partial [Archangium sp.]|uniref:AHH domain-containing protein n=1 Tax=Archangium sp. TaxID=1872627 RepID=UPI002ED8F331
SLDDPANKVRVNGHKGPHPREYHEEVYRRLNEATLDRGSIQQCRAVLIDELTALAKVLPSLLMRGEPARFEEGFYGMRIDPTRVGDAKVFRTWGWTTALIVSEDVKMALELVGITGAKFKDVTGPAGTHAD